MARLDRIGLHPVDGDPATTPVAEPIEIQSLAHGLLPVGGVPFSLLLSS